MTAEEAEKLGYKVVRASHFEIGLTKNGKGLRTWWYGENELPGLDHPVIQEHIRIQEEMEAEGLA